MPMEKQRHSFTTANWDCVSHLAATVDPPGKDALLLLGECGTAGSPLASTDITLTWGEECLPLTWPPLTPWAWGGVGLLALGREEISGFPLHPHWFHPRGEGGTASPGWTFRLTTLPLLSGAGGGGSVTVLSMVFGCTKDRGYCLKVFYVSRLPLFLSFGLRE